jgi:dihydrofolate reductase
MQRTWTGKVFIATSLDGYIARADGDIEWLTDPPADESHVAPPTPPPSGFDYDSHMSTVDHLVMGRGTYEKVLTFGEWPFPDHRVLVLSTTLRTDDGRITIVRSTEDAVADLNRNNAKGVYVDGGQVIADFLRRGLIDELTLTRAPVLLGSGLPLFGRIDGDIRLTHLGTTTVGSGMTTSRYRIG